MSNEPVRIRSMPWEDMRQMLRVLGPEIGRLAKRGDILARAVVLRYQYAADHPADLTANRELRIAFEEYVHRDLLDSERAELVSRYNHQVAEPEKPLHVFAPRLVMPGTDRKH